MNCKKYKETQNQSVKAAAVELRGHHGNNTLLLAALSMTGRQSSRVVSLKNYKYFYKTVLLPLTFRELLNYNVPLRRGFKNEASIENPKETKSGSPTTH